MEHGVRDNSHLPLIKESAARILRDMLGKAWDMQVVDGQEMDEKWGKGVRMQRSRVLDPDGLVVRITPNCASLARAYVSNLTHAELRHFSRVAEVLDKIPQVRFVCQGV